MDDELPKSGGKGRLLKAALGLGIAAVIALGVGMIGHLSGAGWFGYRSWMYGEGELYALNLGATPLWISVDGREKIEVPAENANMADLMGGTSRVEVFDADGKPLTTYDITVDGSDALLKLTDDGCLAVVDITPFYGGQKKPKLDFDAYLKPNTRVWIAQSQNVVWPRKDFPPRLEGGKGKGLWFEIVACELFDEPNFLDAYLATRIERRMAQALGKEKPQ